MNLYNGVCAICMALTSPTGAQLSMLLSPTALEDPLDF